MEQLTLNINQQLAHLMSTVKWRNCQRKQYNIYAILPPAGFVFANRLEQPKEFKYIQQRFGKCIVHQSELLQQDMHVLGNNCYVTDGRKLVLCGTQGELWTVTPEKFLSSYMKLDGSRPEKVPTSWTMFSRVPETAPNAKGIQVPIRYLGIYDAGWGVLRMNDPDSPGHYRGDILVISNDGQSVSTINNAVFANTFNLNVGGWAQSGCIAPANSIKPITLDFVTKTYVFANSHIVDLNAILSKYEKCNETGSFIGRLVNFYKTDKFIIIKKNEFPDLIIFFEDDTYAEAELPNTAAPTGYWDPRQPVESRAHLMGLLKDAKLR